jgi:hypothetical protein
MGVAARAGDGHHQPGGLLPKHCLPLPRQISTHCPAGHEMAHFQRH